MKSSFKVFITGVCVCIFSLSSFFSPANNIRINGTVKVAQGTGDTLVLSFPLRWDNSWRDQFNWDAAWVFLKYKSGTGGWSHVNLCAGGHRFVDGSGLPVPFNYMPGNTGSSTVGLFIYRNTLEAGNTPEITCQVKCLKSSLGGLTAEKFANHEGFVLAQAVEMVYVSYGAYYLGDGSCSNRFAGPDKNQVLIDSEDAITAATATKVYPVANNITGSAQSIAAVYPKGYKGFYMMKYEVSQEQWIHFLNTLTYTQQQERLPNLATSKEGDYIFGSKSEPSNRNGIIVAEPSYNSNSVIFANNLHNDDSYSQDDDGKTIACNYLSPSDMLAYCSWAGLRPMSELEYEKACRQSYPEPPVQNEYAWHDNIIPSRLSTVSNSGMRNERSNTINANVNAGNTFGPVRCGLFATGSSTQQSAGTAFWGGAELSGNLKEMCYNIAYTGFNGSTMGTGVYNIALWSATPAHFGIRGGGFSSADSLLRVSDRTEAGNYFTVTEQRDSTVGFRGVRTIGNDITITQGNLVAKTDNKEITAVCPYDAFELSVTGTPQAKTTDGNIISGLEFTYMWYIQEQGGTWNVIPGEVNALLNYANLPVKNTAASVNYLFRRKAICNLGESFTISEPIKVTNPTITITPVSLETTLDLCDRPGATLSAKSVASGGTFSWKYENTEISATGSYRPRRKNFEPVSNTGGTVQVSCQYAVNGCQSDITTVNIRIAKDTLLCPLTMQDNGGNTYDVIKINCQCWMATNMNVSTGRYCNSNNTAYCNTYGGLYTRAQANVTCPSGWKLPDNNDWNILILNNGPASGFKPLPGGSNVPGYSQVGVYGWWWSSQSPYYASYSEGWLSGLQAYNHPSDATFSVRCVKK